MASTITVKPTEFNASLIEFTEPQLRKGKGKDATEKLISFIRYDGKPLWLETPWLSAPFGVSSFNKGDTGTVDWSVNLSARSNGLETDELIGSFFDQLRAMEPLLIEFGVKYSKTIFGEEHETAVVKALFNKFVKQDKEQKYPPRIAPKIPRHYNTDSDNVSRPNIEFFSGSRDPVELESYEQLAGLVPKGSCVRAFITPRIYFVSGKFGLTWNVMSMKAQANTTSRPSGLKAFSDESPDAYMERTKKDAAAADAAAADAADADADADTDAVTNSMSKLKVADDAADDADDAADDDDDDAEDSSSEDDDDNDEA